MPVEIAQAHASCWLVPDLDMITGHAAVRVKGVILVGCRSHSQRGKRFAASGEGRHAMLRM